MKVLGKLALTLTVIGLVSSPVVGWAGSHEHGSHKHGSAKQVKPYPLDTCPISGEKLELTEKNPSINYHGQEIKFCCKKCIGKFKQNPGKYMPKIKAAAKKVKPYPFKTCIVSGEKLDEMGKPYVLVRHGQEIKFCCKDCVKDFAKDEQKYLRKIAAGR